MPDSKRFLLRLDPRLFDALRRWADDDLRSINAQIEYLLTDVARRAGRLPRPGSAPGPAAGPPSTEDDEDDQIDQPDELEQELQTMVDEHLVDQSDDTGFSPA
jgi:hypothetical protein